LVTSPTP